MDSADLVGSKRIKVYKLLFCLPLLLLPISAAIVVCSQLMKVARERQAVAAYSKELQDLQSKGLLWDSTKLATDYELNTQTDHGRWSKICSELHWLAVEGKVSGVPYFDRDTPTDEVEVLNSSKSWSNAKACIEFTSSCNDLLTKIRNSVASEKPYPFQFRINYSLTDFSGVTELREVRELLSLDAQVALYSGESQRVFDDTIALFRLARHLEVAPMIQSRLTEYACRRQALLIVQRAIEEDVFDMEQLDEIDRYCQENSEIGSRWTKTLKEEFGSVAALFLNPNLGERNLYVKLPPRGEDGLFYLSIMRRAWDLDASDWERFRANVSALTTEFKEKTADVETNIEYSLSHTLMPDLLVLADLFISDAQLHRQARIAIALKKYWNINQSFPRTLAELQLDLENKLSPFGDEPFGYQLVDGQAVLWGSDVGQGVHKVPGSFEELLADEVKLRRNVRLVWRLNSQSGKGKPVTAE